MSLLTGLVALADNLTQSFGLQADVVYFKFLAVDGAGKRSYADAVSRKAIYVRKVKQVRRFDGEMGVSNAQITFLDPTTISEFDKIVLPDGTTQPIIGTDAFVDSSNGPVLTEIFLG
jgi:predicted metalloprotease